MRIEVFICIFDMEDLFLILLVEFVVMLFLMSLFFNIEGLVINLFSFFLVFSFLYLCILFSVYKDNVNNLRNIFSILISFVRSLLDFNGLVEEFLFLD